MCKFKKVLVQFIPFFPAVWPIFCARTIKIGESMKTKICDHMQKFEIFSTIVLVCNLLFLFLSFVFFYLEIAFPEH